MQRHIPREGILTHTTMNISKLTSNHFVVACAAYNTKHVISCSKFIHTIYKNSFPTTQTINRDSTTMTCYKMLKEKNCCLLYCSEKDITKL